LISLGENCGDEPLTKGIVENIINGRRRDPQATSRITVNIDIGLQSLILKIASHISEIG